MPAGSGTTGTGETPHGAFSEKVRLREQAAVQLMTHLDPSKVTLIQQDFQKLGGMVDVVAFVTIMEEYLPRFIYNDVSNATDATGVTLSRDELVSNIIDLFREVDVNGDGFMEWEEFTRFMVEKAALFNEQLALDRVPDYRHNTRVSVSYGQSQYRPREAISGITVLPRHQQFACIEEHSPYIALYNARAGNMLTAMKCDAVPLSMCHVEPMQALIACCSDMTMVRWNVGDCSQKVRFKQRSKWPTPDTQMSLCWQPAHQLVYSGSVSGPIYTWDIEKREQLSRFDGHTDIVMQLLNLDYLDNVVSASLDTSIRIWDSYTEQQTVQLTGHAKGVNSLAYNAEHRFLVSSGFDHDAFVWSPFVSTLLFKLKGHRAALVGCQTVEGTSELLTADTSGIFKLWDLRNFQCIQTFTSDHEPGDVDDLTDCLNCFVHTKLPPSGRLGDFRAGALMAGGRRGGGFGVGVADAGADEDDPPKDGYRIIAASKKVLFFDQDREKKEKASDEAPIVAACFNEESLTILSACERSVKIWDALLGSVKRHFRNISTHDISAICLDDRKRKFVLGDVSGDIVVYNYMNGASMKRCTMTPNAPVTQLIYCDPSKSMLAAFNDGTIRIYDEADIETCKVLRCFDEAYLHRGDLSSVSLLCGASMVASGGGIASEGLRLWDFDTGKCDLIIKTPTYEIVSMVNLEDLPLVLVASSDSRLRLWGVKHAKFKGYCLAEFTNIQPDNAMMSPSGVSVCPVPRGSQAPVPPKDADESLEGSITQVRSGEPLAPSLQEIDAHDAYIEETRRFQARMRLDTPNLPIKRTRAAVKPNTVRFRNDSAFDQFLPGQSARTAASIPVNEATAEGQGSEADEPWMGFTPPMRRSSVVSVLAWDAQSQCVYTGDDAGRLMKWSLQDVLTPLGLGRVKGAHDLDASSPSSASPLARSSGGGAGAGVAGGAGVANGGIASMPLHRRPKIASADKICLRWSVDRAHDECLSAVHIVHEARAVLTSAGDMCIRLWSSAGEPLGLLLQGLRPGIKNPDWRLRVDVATRQELEAKATWDMMQRIEHRKGEKSCRYNTSARLRDQLDAGEPAPPAQPEQHEPLHGGKRGERNALGGQQGFEGLEQEEERERAKLRKLQADVARRRSSQLGLLAPPQDRRQSEVSPAPASSSSEKEREELVSHNRVLAVLNGVKNMHVQSTSGLSDVRAGSTKIRQKHRRLPPHLNIKDALAAPPIQLTELGPGFKKKTVPAIDPAPIRENTNLPPIYRPSPHDLASTPSLRPSTMPSSLVPPSPLRGSTVDDETVASFERLSKQLDALEAEEEETNVFHGRRVGLGDFAKANEDHSVVSSVPSIDQPRPERGGRGRS